jgi:hypothetical protein
MRALVLSIAVAGFLGCYADSQNGPVDLGPGVDPEEQGQPVKPDAESMQLPDEDDAGAMPIMGVPCDVQQIVRTSCAVGGCHAPTGAHSLSSYEELMKPSEDVPSESRAQQSLAKMRAKVMPPSRNATGGEIGAFEAWATQGYAKVACGSVPMKDAGSDASRDSGSSTRDGGSSTGSDAGDAAAPFDPFTASPRCTSAKTSTFFDGSTTPPANRFDMNPGKACGTCHTRTIAGTVFPTAHEPDLCAGINGTASTAQIVVTGANGVSRTLTVASSGNFKGSLVGVALPFSVKVISNGRTRQMGMTLRTGDCNSCHTQTGANGAPGRIVAP